jgi:GNAT superfamily N-acetyltransferase
VDTRPEDPAGRHPQVVPGTRTDLAALSEALADAFFDDPVMSWILRQEQSRIRRLARLFSVQLRGHYLPLETVWTTPDHAGAALWAPPGHAIIAPTTILRYLPDMVRALGRHALRALRTLNHVESLHPKTPPHWYLGVLGTRRASQGKGIGSSLLTPVLDRCDAEGIPAYLESSKHANIAFYGRHGFEVTGEIALPFGGPSVWPMWRDPRPR